MKGQPLHVISHTDTRWSARMKTCELAVLQGNAVIMADETHEHAGDERGQYLRLAFCIVCWKNLASVIRRRPCALAVSGDERVGGASTSGLCLK